MPQSARAKDHPLSLRLPQADIAMIDRAASILGRSRTEFMRDAAVRAAEEVVMQQRLIRMDAASFADFMAALDAPAAPVPEMVVFMSRRAPWEVPQD